VEKLIYLLWEPRRREPDATLRQLLEDVAPKLLVHEPRGLAMNISDSAADVPAPLPTPADEQPLSAQVSLWVDCVDRRGPLEAALKETGCRLAGYLVTESLYTDYGDNEYSPVRDWTDGGRSPGVMTVALLEKPEWLDEAEWIKRWHGTQSPVSAAIQPRMRYVRNAVVRPLTGDAPPYRGIVEEAWPSARHITDPMLFYCAGGSDERLQENMTRMMESVTAFLDLERIRSFTMSEYLLKTPKGSSRCL